MKYFTLEELTSSATAKKLGVDNTPTDEHKQHLIELIEEVLDPLREGWSTFCKEKGLGTPALIVTSGYRGFRLNKAVRGVQSSAHCYGYAADIVPNNGELLRFKHFCRTWFESRGFDQLISEDEGFNGTPRWMHIGYKNRDGIQRFQMLSMNNGQYSAMTA